MSTQNLFQFAWFNPAVDVERERGRKMVFHNLLQSIVCCSVVNEKQQRQAISASSGWEKVVVSIKQVFNERINM